MSSEADAWVTLVEPAVTPVTVTVCAVFQLLLVNVNAADTDAVPAAAEVGVIVTSSVGAVSNTIV